MAKVKLTQQFVLQSDCPDDQRKVNYFDTQMTGLLLKVQRSGHKSYYYRFTHPKTGKVKEVKLANEGQVTLKQARQMAGEIQQECRLGRGSFLSTQHTAPLFCEFIQGDYLPLITTYKKSWQTDVYNLKNHLLPQFGEQRMDQITPNEIQNWVTRLRLKYAPATCNKLLILLKYIFNCALRLERLPSGASNPAKGVNRYIENNQREVYLSNGQISRLIDAVKCSKNVMLPYIISFILCTGARRGEVLNARWALMDMEGRQWTLPDNKSGKVHHIPLSDLAIQVLEQIASNTDLKTDTYVFAYPKTGHPYKGIHQTWDYARKKAGLPHVRIHDLRHTFASQLVNQNVSLYTVQKILGHQQAKTTQRYAHLDQKQLIDAANCALTGVKAMHQWHPKRLMGIGSPKMLTRMITPLFTEWRDDK